MKRITSHFTPYRIREAQAQLERVNAPYSARTVAYGGPGLARAILTPADPALPAKAYGKPRIYNRTLRISRNPVITKRDKQLWLT